MEDIGRELRAYSIHGNIWFQENESWEVIHQIAILRSWLAIGLLLALMSMEMP